MPAMKVLSWNVNGVRAALGKGLLDWMRASRADVICLQEVKATPGDVQHVEWPRGYEGPGTRRARRATAAPRCFPGSVRWR